MKRIIHLCLFVALLATSFSFTSHSKRGGNVIIEQKLFKKYTVYVGTVYNLPGSNCNITIAVFISFNWNGPGNAITGVTVTGPVFQVNCPPSITWTRESIVSSIKLEESDANCSDIVIEPTGDHFIDSVLSDESFLRWLKSEINVNIEAHKI